MNICEGTTLKGKKCSRKVSNGLFCGQHKVQCKPEKQFVEEKPDDCPVCCEIFTETDKHLECGHWVHLDCVRKSMRAECPICRKPVRHLDERTMCEIEQRRTQTINELHEEEYERNYQIEQMEYLEQMPMPMPVPMPMPIEQIMQQYVVQQTTYEEIAIQQATFVDRNWRNVNWRIGRMRINIRYRLPRFFQRT